MARPHSRSRSSPSRPTTTTEPAGTQAGVGAPRTPSSRTSTSFQQTPQRRRAPGPPAEAHGPRAGSHSRRPGRLVTLGVEGPTPPTPEGEGPDVRTGNKDVTGTGSGRRRAGPARPQRSAWPNGVGRRRRARRPNDASQASTSSPAGQLAGRRARPLCRRWSSVTARRPRRGRTCCDAGEGPPRRDCRLPNVPTERGGQRMARELGDADQRGAAAHAHGHRRDTVPPGARGCGGRDLRIAIAGKGNEHRQVVPRAGGSWRTATEPLQQDAGRRGRAPAPRSPWPAAPRGPGRRSARAGPSHDCGCRGAGPRARPRRRPRARRQTGSGRWVASSIEQPGDVHDHRNLLRTSCPGRGQARRCAPRPAPAGVDDLQQPGHRPERAARSAIGRRPHGEGERRRRPPPFWRRRRQMHHSDHAVAPPRRRARAGAARRSREPALDPPRRHRRRPRRSGTDPADDSVIRSAKHSGQGVWRARPGAGEARH